MNTLPHNVLSAAFKSETGEYGWPTQNIETAINAIALSELAILGGHAWFVEHGRLFDFYPGTGSLGFKMWDTRHQNPDEPWADYCRRTASESIHEIRTSGLEGTIPTGFSEYLYINPIFVAKDDPRSLVPRDKHDFKRASAAVNAGYPTVEPILSELLEWMQDMDWPVAKRLAPFLATVGEPLIPHIREIFETDEEIWKRWIITEIFDSSRPVAKAFRSEMKRIISSPTQFQKDEKLPRIAKRIFKKYRWKL